MDTQPLYEYLIGTTAAIVFFAFWMLNRIRFIGKAKEYLGPQASYRQLLIAVFGWKYYSSHRGFYVAYFDGLILLYVMINLFFF